MEAQLIRHYKYERAGSESRIFDYNTINEHVTMKTHLPLSNIRRRQKSGEASLQHVRVAAYCVSRVAVVRALAVEAEVVRRGHEKCLEYVPFGDVIDLGGHVEYAAHDRHCPPEAEYPREYFSSLTVTKL